MPIVTDNENILLYNNDIQIEISWLFNENIRGNVSMNMYEVILNIIDKHGPASIPSICHRNKSKSRIYAGKR